MNIRKNEIYRYMGLRTSAITSELETIVDEMTTKVLECISPKCIYREMSLDMSDGRIFIGGNRGMTVESSNLLINLKGCDKVLMFAATLGSGADTLVRRYEVTSMSYAAVIQAVCTEVIEAYCNEVNEAVRLEQMEKGYYLRPRFSPGYGDFKLGHQVDFFRMLDISRKLGITLSSGLLMIPTKSVTALIGLSRDSENCSIEKCRYCNKKDCDFR